jgi:hypothetical protein
MKPAEFVTAYRRDAVEYASIPAEVEELLAESREWSHRWGVLLHDALALREVPYPKAFDRFSASYLTWFWRSYLDMWTQLVEWAERTDDSATWARALMEINFHQLNILVQQSWTMLLYRPPPVGLPTTLVDRDCYNLAKSSLGFVRLREQFLGEEVFFDPEAEQIRAWQTGSLTEVDAYIALLDMTRQRGNIITLPAPAQFEHLAGAANVDFLVFDKRYDTVRGVQVKAQVDNDQAQRYDRARVTLIDGARDLQNTRALRTDPRHSARHVVTWPGLIAAHFILELKDSKLTDRWEPRKELIKSKLAARHYVGTTPSRNAFAYRAVAERVSRELADVELLPVPPTTPWRPVPTDPRRR